MNHHLTASLDSKEWAEAAMENRLCFPRRALPMSELSKGLLAGPEKLAASWVQYFKHRSIGLESELIGLSRRLYRRCHDSLDLSH